MIKHKRVKSDVAPTQKIMSNLAIEGDKKKVLKKENFIKSRLEAKPANDAKQF